jgi:hypothetical protein
VALSVKLYRVVGKGKDRRYVAIDLWRGLTPSVNTLCSLPATAYVRSAFPISHR